MDEKQWKTLLKSDGTIGHVARMWPDRVPVRRHSQDDVLWTESTTLGSVGVMAAWQKGPVVKVCLVRPGESLSGPCERWLEIMLTKPEMIVAAIEAA